ncbi:MAG: thiamine pyrophosphate-dependent dehydrogenase E1 component subunit alpha [Anaerolineales bacterium]|jgi:TPP-dependent pyruvate/acetoin dehydrogenase alpha subunit
MNQAKPKPSSLRPPTDDADLWDLYQQMLRSRLFEQSVQELWEAGKISGEMHMGIGEEAIVAGVVCQLQEGDAMALDHRGTPPLIMRGVDPVLLLRELLGRPDGLCRGMGGHMHLFSRKHLAASSGIVGASGPAGVGFALAAEYLRPGNVAVAFFGEGSVNQGMMMEAMNLAAAWTLPLIFICKDNEWAISTVSSRVTAGPMEARAQGFGLGAIEVDGNDVEAVWKAAGEALQRAREGYGPTFLHAYCARLEGHFLGDPLIRVGRWPWKEFLPIVGPLVKSLTKVKGAHVRERLKGTENILSAILGAAQKDRSTQEDPILKTRQKLEKDANKLRKIEEEVRREMEEVRRDA